MMKICSKCKTEYPATNEYFHKNSRAKDGLFSSCKPCSIKSSKKWNNDNHEQKVESQKIWREKNAKTYHPRWRKENMDKCVKATRKWILKNPDKHQQNVKKCIQKIKGVYGIFENEICLYVGESKQLRGRIYYHKSWIKNKSQHPSSQKELYEQLQQHSNLEFRILEETENHVEREKYFINLYKPKYNN